MLLVVYPPDNQEHVFAAGGKYADFLEVRQHIALETAANHDRDGDRGEEYFAWYNRGTSLVRLQITRARPRLIKPSSAVQSATAGAPPLPHAVVSDRPLLRLDHYSGRYQDVIDLVDILILAGWTNPTCRYPALARQGQSRPGGLTGQ